MVLYKMCDGVKWRDFLCVGVLGVGGLIFVS